MIAAPAPDVLAALHAAAFAGERGWTAEEFAALLATPGALVMAETAGFALGRVTLDEAELLTIAVDPAARRAGLGRRLLAGFEAVAAAQGAARMFLEVAADNAPARALYAAAGWGAAGRRRGYYARAGGAAVDALVLTKQAAPPGLPRL